MFGTKSLNDEHDCNVVSMNSLNIHDANDMQSHKLGDAMFDEDDMFSPPSFDEKKIYPVIISANLSEQEEERLLKTLKKHRVLLDILSMILRALVPLYANTKLNWTKAPNQLEIINDG